MSLKKHKTKTCSADRFFLMSAYTFVNMIFQPVTKFDGYNMLIYDSFILFIVRLLSFGGKSYNLPNNKHRYHLTVRTACLIHQSSF